MWLVIQPLQLVGDVAMQTHVFLTFCNKLIIKVIDEQECHVVPFDFCVFILAAYIFVIKMQSLVCWYSKLLVLKSLKPSHFLSTRDVKLRTKDL